jgi:hypothetical protein
MEEESYEKSIVVVIAYLDGTTWFSLEERRKDRQLLARRICARDLMLRMKHWLIVPLFVFLKGSEFFIGVMPNG